MVLLVLAKIEAELSIPGSKFKFVTIGCRSIRIGSYKVTNTDAGQQLTVDLTEFGLKFAMPHSTISMLINAHVNIIIIFSHFIYCQNKFTFYRAQGSCCMHPDGTNSEISSLSQQ